ncbi:hypothetical protein ABER23_33020 [Paenibacillus lautus]|uniref:hypothetical protein n=1 Tax=Paenibacillus lautus TaxID=1401 RepID=UPI003D2E07A5
MRKQKLKSEDIQKTLITVLLIIATLCMLCILVAFLSVLYREFTEWDFLAFLGSIIGGFITWFGVKLTISSKRDDKEIADYYDDISILYFLVQETRYILNVETMQDSQKEPDGRWVINKRGTILMHLDFIIDFIDILEKNFSDLIKSTDWEVFEQIDFHTKTLASAKTIQNRYDFYFLRDGEDRMEGRVKDYINNAKKIHLILSEYKEQRTQKYYNLKEKITK